MEPDDDAMSVPDARVGAGAAASLLSALPMASIERVSVCVISNGAIAVGFQSDLLR